MRVAVTGATGHLGANVVRDLLAHGFGVRAVCHPSSKMDALEGLDVEIAHADVLQPESLLAAFQDADAVVHLAAMISIIGDPNGTVMRTNVEGARNVARACLDNCVSKLVHISSIHALKSSPRDKRIDESSSPADHGCSAYDRSKAAGEREILAATEDGLDATILNPTGILGPHDYAGSLSGQMLRSLFQGRLPALIEAGFDWVDARDVASVIRTSLRYGQPGERYVISGRWASFKRLAELCEAVSATPALRLVLPLWAAFVGLPFLRLQSRITGVRPLYSYESLMILRNSNKNYMAEKAHRDFAFIPRPLRETINDTHDWNAELGLL